MNHYRTEARARQNRLIALILTILLHLVVIGWLIMGKSDKPSTESAIPTTAHAKP
jgi:membrane protein involved in colicin uptake